MASIGSASLVLSANTAKLNSGLQQAQGQISGFMTQLSSGVSFFAAGPVGAAVAAVSTLFNVLRQGVGEFMETADAAAKASRALGISTETYMGLQHAANLSGLSQEQFGASLRRLSKNLAQAAAGNEQARSAFNALGLSMDQLQGQGLEQSLGRIADQIAAIEDPMQRARVAVQLFGEEGGPRMLALLESGSQGIRNMVEEARRLGITVNDVEASRIEAANDAMTRVGAAIKGIFGRIAVALAPAIEAISGTLTNAIAAVQPIVEGLGKLIQLNFMAMKPAIDLIAAAIQGLMAVIGPVIDFAVNMLQGFQQAWADIFAELAPLWEELKTAAMDTWNSIVEFFAPVGDTFNSIVEWLQSLGLSFDGFKEFALSAIQLVAVGLSYLNDIGKMVGGFIITYMITPIVTGFRMLMEVVASVVRRLASIPVVGRAFRGASQGLDAFVDSVRRNEGRLRETGQNLMNTRLGDSRQAVDAFFDRIRQRNQQTRDEVARNNPVDPIRQQLIQDITKLEDRLREEIATFGMSRDEIELWRLTQRGATEDMLANARALMERRRALEENQKMMEEGRRLTEEMRTPIEKFEDEMERLDRMLEAGAISWEVYQRATNRAMEQLAQASRESLEIKTPSALVKGSREAVSTIIKAQLQNQDRENVMQRILAEQRDIQRRQLAAALDTNRLLRREQPVETI